ncbi:homoserine dehydrogenase [Roseomonas haemaphysalidis]|uniref:Homoserine dehydrogenase n=1 Tax=Roseomonas haemaphysalidis TaxID=2768162 RepID=A0ABS3KNL7_9PROT|nr:homoserine dehydrogenase [Roseomonas haemaphysalidis]MBO1079059.1 homoserine dehydrogenase [Roseomonas haemaphysalidis]
MSRPLSVGVAGLGTVGAGVLTVLRQNAALIAARAGRPIAVTAVSARDRSRDRGVKLDGLRWYEDAASMAADPNVDVVVELVGGSDGPAKALVEAALAAGKPVVTANKALLALHGAALAEQAEKAGVALAFEAAVAGGIPAIKGLREGLAANRISRVTGILNGTCNYILTCMRDQKREFGDVLAEAQKLGYAEADPSFDIDGVDAAHKLAILAALAFGRPVDFSAVHVEGIRHVSALDIRLAEELGYRIKLLGIASEVEGGVSARVHPCMVPVAHPIAVVDGVYNAVVAEGDFVGRVVLEGRGAGAGPTASAVVADLIDIARGRATPVWGAAGNALAQTPAVPMAQHHGAYYLRLMVLDRPGVLADVTGVLRDHGISLESMIQRGRAPGEAVPIVLTTHDCQEAAMRGALARIAALESVLEPPALIRIETLTTA